MFALGTRFRSLRLWPRSGRTPALSRTPHPAAEENNSSGFGSLSDEEVALFVDVVDLLRASIAAAYGADWDHPVSAGDGYVVTGADRSPAYTGIRRTASGYMVTSAEQRSYEGTVLEAGRFEDALKGFACEVVDSFREDTRSGRARIGYTAWMWNGSPGRDVIVTRRPQGELRYTRRGDPAAWIDGRRTTAPLSHGLAMSVPDFVAAIIDHPPVTSRDATQWPA